MNRSVTVLFGILLMLLSTFAFAQYPWYVAYTNQPGDTTLGTSNYSFAGTGRGAFAGTDLDQDGIYEICTTDYNRNGVFLWEVTADNTVELVWASNDTINGNYFSLPRDVNYGDLDNNGVPEIIFPVGRDMPSTDPIGYHVYEWDGVVGSDNYGDFPVAVIVPNDTAPRLRPENFRIADVDGDGQEELIVLNFSFNGNSDIFQILSVTGTFSSGFWGLNEEFSYDHGNIPSRPILEFAAVDAGIIDADNDGKLEVWVIGNAFNTPNTHLFSVEANGANSYTRSDSLIYWIEDNDYPLKSGVSGDFDGNGIDEYYYAHYKEPILHVITDIPDALTWTDSTVSRELMNFTNDTVTTGIASMFGMAARGNKLYAGCYSYLWEFEYMSGPAYDSTSWSYHVAYHDPYDSSIGAGITGGIEAPENDMDGDGWMEIVTFWQGMTDSLNQSAGTIKSLRVLEESISGLQDDWTFITPDMYKLEQNYPNPFNPSTTINFTLPVNKQISITIYNSLGQVVKTLVDNVKFEKGSHSAVWDGTNDAGAKVASGMYIYTMKYGNFTQSKRMTLLK